MNRYKTSGVDRCVRVSELIQEELSLIFQRELIHPDLPKFITINEVTVSRDLSHAKLYVTSLDKEADIHQTVVLLNEHADSIRFMLAKRISLKYMPKLTFRYDESIETAEKIRSLLHEVGPSDEVHN